MIIFVTNVIIHVTGFDFKPTVVIMYFSSTNRQVGDVSQFVDDNRITLPTSRPSNSSYAFAKYNTDLSQPSIVTKQKRQSVGSIILNKTRTNKLMVGKMFEQRSCR